MPRVSAKLHYETLSEMGKRVREERQRKGLTQEAFAELVDIHPRVLQKIEAGRTNVLATTLIRIQAVLACPWPRLLPDASRGEA